MTAIFDYGLLPIRIMAGLTFLAHGIPKFFDLSGGYGFFESINLPPELFVPVGVLEVAGGLAILLGIVTRIASALLIIEMIGAILIVKLSKGFIGGYEFELLLISISATLVILGPGKISIENYIFKEKYSLEGNNCITKLLKQI